MLGLSIVKVLITQCKMQYKVQYKFSIVIQASIYGVLPCVVISVTVITVCL